MASSPASSLQKAVRDIPNFPKKGIVFKDITPILKDPRLFKIAIDLMGKNLSEKKIDYVVGIESRGFIFSTIIACRLKAGFVPVRKEGKLPYLTNKTAYALEYGEAVLEIHKDAIEKGSRVVIVDDLLATGGTALAAAQLVEGLGAKVVGLSFLIELSFLGGRKKLSRYGVHTVIRY
ncbi:MAG: adenine phosphoribosyltransferase [Candidatus Omnitrophica bacterium]|nr:adenine phosphoribosyltransferase [Candidatus Omnitrophota bacterium]